MIKIPYIDLEDYEFNKDEINIIPKKLAIKHNIIVLNKIGNILNIAIPYQQDHNFREMIKFKELLDKKLNHFVIFVFANQKVIQDAIKMQYRRKTNVCYN